MFKQYSKATEELAQLLPKLSNDKLDYNQADQMVKGYFIMLRHQSRINLN